MEDPPNDITGVIHLLTQSPPATQRLTIEKYFTPSASFTHPFCRTGSFVGSRWLIWAIYRWYKIMSPRIELGIESIGISLLSFKYHRPQEEEVRLTGAENETAYDTTNLILYVTLHQIFRIWLIPFHSGAHVSLTTVLHLEKDSVHKEGEGTTKTKYLIRSQNDLYAVDQFVEFVSLTGLLGGMVIALQFVATAMCVLGMWLFWPITWAEQRVIGGNRERGVKEIVT